jgi:5-deoxy-glucuronate isomerase
MSELLISGASIAQPDGTILTVTPESAGWQRVGFEVLALAPGGTAEIGVSELTLDDDQRERPLGPSRPRARAGAGAARSVAGPQPPPEVA